MMGEVEGTVAAYDRGAEAYANKWFCSPVKDVLHRFASQLPPGARVLDAGCGHGRDSKWLSERGIQTVGLDLSEGLLEQARACCPGLTFMKGDMRSLPFPARSFHGILAMASILHIPKADLQRTLREFRRVLRPGGLLFVAVQEGSGERWVENDPPTIGPRFYSFYSKREMARQLSVAGFRIRNITRQGGRSRVWLHYWARA